MQYKNNYQYIKDKLALIDATVQVVLQGYTFNNIMYEHYKELYQKCSIFKAKQKYFLYKKLKHYSTMLIELNITNLLDEVNADADIQITTTHE